MRDLDKNPYSPEEERVAKWLSEKGLGGGDDPIGFMLTSYEYLKDQSKRDDKPTTDVMELEAGVPLWEQIDVEVVYKIRNIIRSGTPSPAHGAMTLSAAIADIITNFMTDEKDDVAHNIDEISRAARDMAFSMLDLRRKGKGPVLN